MSTIKRHLILGVLAVALVLPFVWMILTSLKPLAEVSATNWIPSKLEWRNYMEVFRLIPFGRFYWNSLLVASWVTFVQVFTSAMAAYSFARLQWPGREKVFLLYLATMTLPGIVLIIPNYQLMMQLGLVDTLTGLVLPSSFSAIGTYLLRQFMLSIPKTLDEAAEMDGASHWHIFWEIVLPLARPGVVSLAVMTFIGNFQNFFWPLVLMKSVHKYTLPVGLLFFDSTRGQSTHLMMAAVTMSVLPMIVAFIFLQKHIVQGIQLSGAKND